MKIPVLEIFVRVGRRTPVLLHSLLERNAQTIDGLGMNDFERGTFNVTDPADWTVAPALDKEAVLGCKLQPCSRDYGVAATRHRTVIGELVPGDHASVPLIPGNNADIWHGWRLIVAFVRHGSVCCLIGMWTGCASTLAEWICDRSFGTWSERLDD